MIGRRLRPVAFALSLAILAGGTTGIRSAEAAAAAAQDSLEIGYAGGLLTVRAADVPLSRVLSEIAEAAGFRLVLEGDLDRPVTRRLAKVSLDRGLERLLDGISYMRTYDSLGGRSVLAELRVIGAASGARAPVSAVMVRKPPRFEPTPEMAARLDASEAERLDRVRRLRGKSGSDVTQELALYLRQDESAVVRRIAASGLARQGGLEARDALTAALADSDTRVRRQALISLAQHWGPEASGALAGTLASDSDAEARALAARMLGRTGGAGAVGALEAALQDLDPKVRQLARQSLARLEARSAENTLDQ